MKNNASREIILSRISDIKGNRSNKFEQIHFDNTAIYKAVLPDLVSCFKNELESISGKCFLSENQEEQLQQIKSFIENNHLQEVYCRDTNIITELKKRNIPCINDEKSFENMKAGITGCEFLIARTGSVIVTSAGESGRQMNVFPPVHIVIADKSQLLEYPEDALIAIQKKYENSLPSTITTITGPSRTADIEKTLVLGAHGPKEFVIFLRLN
ncbi:MAG TPA: LUD domain-containing protein [Paludibacter sp.]|nr:LUD domain-containing protein [Paludibacter sp.]